MRVYEFAKKLGLSTKDVMEKLEKGGFAVKSHMSHLDTQAMGFLEGDSVVLSATPLKDPVKGSSLGEITAPVQDKDRAKKDAIAQKDTKKEAALVSFQQETSVAISGAKIPLRPMAVSEFSTLASKPVADVILVLLRLGIMAARNRLLSEDMVIKLAHHYQIETEVPVIGKVVDDKQRAVSPVHAMTATLEERLPIVAVLGHVDHGKTTLLDYIRRTRVASREKGGITQHLGAYEALSSQGKIVFLDTPGHEVFSKIRQRGIKVADIAVLVVAADDGVMPQTVEAIKHARSMHVPVIVAINKIDKVDESRLEIIRRELSQHGLLVEEWGGDVVCVPVSAKTGQGVDNLLEMIALQSQMMELRADVSGSAKGYILESAVERGRGPVATLICQNGTLKVGDYIVCGSTGGRVNSLVDSYGRRLESAGPSVPVRVAGFLEAPEVGVYFESVPKESYKTSLDRAQEGQKNLQQRPFDAEGINLIVKTDNDSSREALCDAIVKLSKKSPVAFNIIHAAIGNVSESDVEFAFNTGSTIIGLHVKAESNSLSLAQRKQVNINFFDIIYKLLEDLEERAEGAKKVEYQRVKIGEALVIQVFDIKNIGVIAGASLKEGRVTRDAIAIVSRRNKKIADGKLRSLQREKRSVKEVHAGFEFGFMMDGFDGWLLDDRVEFFVEVPKN